MKTSIALLELPAEIPGERVLLRPFRPGDGPAVWEAIDESRARLRPWLPWVDSHGCPDDAEVFARRAHARWLTRDDLTLGIWEPGTGRLLGGSGCHPEDWDVPWFQIGYWLRTSAEGKGCVTEAVRLVCRLAFETLGANRVHIQCAAGNHRSAAVPRRLGFVEEARLRHHRRSLLGGELEDTLIFAWTADDYRNATRPK